MKGDRHEHCHTDADMLRAGLGMYDQGRLIAIDFALQLVASGPSAEQQTAMLEHMRAETRARLNMDTGRRVVGCGDPDR